MSQVRELVIYIHGIDPNVVPRSHAVNYEALHAGVRSALAQADAFPADLVPVEWGWPFRGVPDPGHEQLSLAQKQIGASALLAVAEEADMTLNPFRKVIDDFRPRMIYGFSDMFYYVSQDGKKSVRGTVASQILKHRSLREAAQSGDCISLTLIGHSAGSVIASDFLFSLFRPEDLQDEDPSDFFVGADDADTRELRDEFNDLRSMARDGRLRIRRLITIGSPITAVALRSDRVVDKLQRRQMLHPDEYGLMQNPPDFGPALTGPRWLNIWDADDLFAWPVTPLFDEEFHETVVRDRQLNVSLSILGAHGAYWQHRRVHREVAAIWAG